jgi:hypothetical protein
MEITILMITKILMTLPSSTLGFLLHPIVKKTGVLSPERFSMPLKDMLLFYILTMICRAERINSPKEYKMRIQKYLKNTKFISNLGT